MEAVIGRLAPSPTGWLHLGHARSFLAAWWSARGSGGQIVLRIEDLDASRARPEFVEGILRDLEWLGLDWEGPLLMQSTRRDAHLAALQSLIAEGRVYPCNCTRADIQGATSAPHGIDGEVIYPGTCWQNKLAAPPTPCAWRFHLPDDSTVPYEDAIAGKRSDRVSEQVGDFVVWTKGDEAAYQLAVVVDDAYQGITEVVRGEDLLASTARQNLLQEALGLAHPDWVHLPLVGDESGRRLAKRAGSMALHALRASGVEPGAIIRWAAHSLGMPSDGQSAQDFVGELDWDSVPKKGPNAPPAWR
jgi:glutamyl-tRNA synthetase